MLAVSFSVVPLFAGVVVGAVALGLLISTRFRKWGYLASGTEDIEVLVTELTSHHVEPFHSISRQEYEAEAAAVSGLSDVAVGFEVKRLAALVGDSHTQAQLDLELTAYPIVVELFADGVIVIGASPEHRDLLGAELLAVHGVSIDETIKAGLPYFSGDTVNGRLPDVVRLLVSPEFLEVIVGPSAVDPGVYTLDVGDQDVAVELEAIPIDRWRSLVSGPQDRQVALAATRPNAFYWYQYLPDREAMYVQYNVCANAPDLSFEDFTEGAFKTITDTGATRLVVDLRLNRGGDSTIFKPFLDRLRAHPLVEQGELYVLIGSNTFSSALMNAVELKTETNAILLGQPTSSSPNHYGEVATFTLPNSGSVATATRFFQLTESNPDALVPDVVVERTSSDFFAGTDATLDRALEH
ncbi:MAG: hypothetical protein GY788_20435, partial [bacterium]|nr:hypothetical protein [bacterium]